VIFRKRVEVAACVDATESEDFFRASLSLGLTLQDIGIIIAVVGVAATVPTYPAGILAHRFHPMRLMVWIKLAIVLVTPLNFVWRFTNCPPTLNFWILIVINVINLSLILVYQATLMPLFLRIFPRERVGQFCWFLAICQAAFGAVGGFFNGLFIDCARSRFPDALFGPNYCYRLIPALNFFLRSRIDCTCPVIRGMAPDRRQCRHLGSLTYSLCVCPKLASAFLLEGPQPHGSRFRPDAAADDPPNASGLPRGS